MKGSLKVLAALGATAMVAALLAPAALAQCPAGREFANFGGMSTVTPVYRIDTNGLQDNNNEIGTFWESSNSNNNAGGQHFGVPSTCPTQGVNGVSAPWWLQGTTTYIPPPFRGIRGFVASPGCTMTLCPNNGASLTVVVEDQTADGSDAGFIAYMADETPAATRWWDYGRTAPANGVPGNYQHTMERFPKANVTSSSGPPPGTTVTNGYANVDVNFHGVSGAGNTALPASSAIASYDIVMFHGGSDPGRQRSAWSPLKSIPYSDAAVVGDQIAVPCPDTAGDTFLAVGVTYKGGAGPAVKSVLVGGSTAVECNPNIAQPDDDKGKPKFRPGHAKPLGHGKR